MANKKLVYVFGADISQAEKEFNRLHNSLDRIGKRAESVGKFFSKARTVPLVGLGALAAKSANDIQEAYKTIQAGTGATGKALANLKKDFEAVGRGSDQNLKVVGKALADMNTRTGATGKTLQDLTANALDAADMLGEDTTQAITAVTRAMGDWGISAQQGTATMDKMFVAAQQTGIGMTQLGEKLVQYGSPLRQMGFDFDTAAAMIAKFEREGVNAELVLGSLRIALAKMSKDGVTDAAAGLQTIIDQIKRAGSAGEATAIAVAKFGSRAGPDMAAAIREGRFELGNLVNALGTAGGAIAKADKETKTLGDRWAETKNQIAFAVQPIGTILIDLANKALVPLTRKVEEFAGWWETLSPTSQDLAVKLGLVLAAIGPTTYAIGGLTRGVADVFKGFGALIGNVGKIVGFFNSVTAAAWASYAAIGATVAAMAWLYSNMDKGPAGKETLSERRGMGDNKTGLSKQISDSRKVTAPTSFEAPAVQPFMAPVSPGVTGGGIPGGALGGSTGGHAKLKAEEDFTAKQKDLVAEQMATDQGAFDSELAAALELGNKIHEQDVARLDQKMTLAEAQALKEQALYEQLASARADADLAAYAQMLTDENAMFLADLEARRETIDAYYQLQMDAHRSLLSVMTEAMMAFHSGFASALGDIVTGAATARDAFLALGKQIIRIFVEWMAKKVTASALGKSLLAAETAASIAAGAATAAAWAPAAAMVSLASFGANSGPAMSGISATVALAQALAIPQLAEGGIVTRPTLALIGEGKDDEMVLPLNNRTLKGLGGGGATVTQNIYGDINTKVDMDELHQGLGQALAFALRG